MCVGGVCISQWSTAYLGFSVSIMFRELPESTGSECLGSMTPETQDIYLRMDHHRRRSGYRLGRIIARQQLLRRIAGGRREAWVEVTVRTCDSVSLLEGSSFFLAMAEESAVKINRSSSYTQECKD